MVKIATVCETYKVPKFKEEFDKAGIVYTIEEFKGMKGMTLFICISEQHIIQPIVERVTKHFQGVFFSIKNPN